RILLNSKTPRFPTGLANSSGALGKNLMDHIMGGGAGGTIPGMEDHAVHGHRPNGIYVPRFRNVKASHRDLLRGYGFQAGAEAAGALDIPPFTDDNPPGLTIHEMGTARMGRDPKTAVLNGHNQCHDVKNLFVTDGACMASTACQNPSITYMALTARAAAYAVEAMKRNEL